MYQIFKIYAQLNTLKQTWMATMQVKICGSIQLIWNSLIYSFIIIHQILSCFNSANNSDSSLIFFNWLASSCLPSLTCAFNLAICDNLSLIFHIYLFLGSLVVAEASFSALFALSPGLAGLLVSSCCFFLAASLLF